MPQGRAAQRRLVKGAKAKNKSTKGAGAARRAVRRDLPALKLLAESSGQLTIGWSHHGGACSAIRRRRRRTCDVCGVQGNEDEPPFPVCGGCDARRYCGEACQIADWEAGHARKCG